MSGIAGCCTARQEGCKATPNKAGPADHERSFAHLDFMCSRISGLAHTKLGMWTRRFGNIAELGDLYSGASKW
jgi:hypothetical protein